MRDVTEAQEMIQEQGCAAETKEKSKRDTEATFSKTSYNVFHKTDEGGGCRRGQDIFDDASDQCDIQSELWVQTVLLRNLGT